MDTTYAVDFYAHCIRENDNWEGMADSIDCMEEWLLSNIQAGRYSISDWEVFFTNGEDALLFKLRFGS